MRRPLLKPEEKRHVNLQTLVTRAEHRKLMRIVKQTGFTISDILREGLNAQLNRWEEDQKCESAQS